MYWTNLTQNGQKQLFQEQNSRGLGRNLSITEAAGHRGGGAGGGHGVLDGSGRTEIAPWGITASLEWGGAARSVSPHGMRISCVRRGGRWAGLSSVCNGGTP